MFKEVNKEEAIMAALRGVPAFRLNVDMDPAKTDQLVFQDIRQDFFEDLVEDTDSRFILDDADDKAVSVIYDAEELVSAVEKAEHSNLLHFQQNGEVVTKSGGTDPDQNEVKTDQNEVKTDQNEVIADQSEPIAEQKVLTGFTPAEVHHRRGPKKVDGARVRELHNEGYSITAIAEELGISITTVKKYI